MTSWESVLVTDPIPDEPAKEMLFKPDVSLRRSLRELWGAREIVRSLAERQLRARYKQAILGFLWAIITPLVLMVAFTLVFDRVGDVETRGAPYALFAYLGLLPWSFFSSSVQSAASSLVSNVPLINKIFCPREVFPLAGVVVAALDTLLSLVALGVLFVVTGFAPKVESVWVVAIVPIQLLFTIGVSNLLSVSVVYLRDLRQGLPLLLQVGIFVTPVAYGFDVVPASARGIYSFVNPLAPVIDAYRRTILFGEAPDLTYLLLGAAGAITWFSFGYWYFKRMEGGIVDVA
jgi:ABC-2 type transport system permease protein/lipopolysaccharide transport system permease protein